MDNSICINVVRDDHYVIQNPVPCEEIVDPETGCCISKISCNEICHAHSTRGKTCLLGDMTRKFNRRFEELERKIELNRAAAEKFESLHEALLQLQELQKPEIDLEHRVILLEKHYKTQGL